MANFWVMSMQQRKSCYLLTHFFGINTIANRAVVKQILFSENMNSLQVVAVIYLIVCMHIGGISAYSCSCYCPSSSTYAGSTYSSTCSSTACQTACILDSSLLSCTSTSNTYAQVPTKMINILFFFSFL